MLKGYFLKLTTCTNNDIIVKISDICMLMADGELCTISLVDTRHGIKVRHNINEIEKMINLTSYKVIGLSSEIN
jgi:hypothetical protein